jgi:hypothetical protein
LLRRGRGRGMVKGWRLEFGKKGDRREGCVTATYGQLMSSRRKRKREREREREREEEIELTREIFPQHRQKGGNVWIIFCFFSDFVPTTTTTTAPLLATSKGRLTREKGPFGVERRRDLMSVEEFKKLSSGFIGSHLRSTINNETLSRLGEERQEGGRKGDGLDLQLWRTSKGCSGRSRRRRERVDDSIADGGLILGLGSRSSGSGSGG